MTDIRHINNITYSDNKRYVSNSNGSDSFSGKSDIQSKKTLSSALTGVGNNTRIEIDYGNYVGGVDINNLYSVDLCGTSVLAKTQTVIGGLNTVTGTSSHVAFKDLNIGSNSADVLCTFSSSGSSHVFENVGSNINLSPVLVQFGTSCSNTIAGAITTGGGQFYAGGTCSNYFTGAITTGGGQFLGGDSCSNYFGGAITTTNQTIDCGINSKNNFRGNVLAGTGLLHYGVNTSNEFGLAITVTAGSVNATGGSTNFCNGVAMPAGTPASGTNTAAFSRVN